jgi:polyferredoxin
MLAIYHTLYYGVITNLQTLIPFKLSYRLLGKNMSTRNQINRLHGRTERFRGDRTNPALAALMAVRMRTVRRVLVALSVDLEMQLDHITERFNASAEDLLAVRFGANALAIVTGEQKLEYGVFVI